MLNRGKHTGDGHAWNTMPDMEVESLRRRGGGSRKGGFGRTPRTPLVTGLIMYGKFDHFYMEISTIQNSLKKFP